MWTQFNIHRYGRVSRRRITLFVCCFLFSVNGATQAASTCYGSTSKGAIDNSRQLPANGPNFRSYSQPAILAGRTWVHSEIHTVIVNSYRQLQSEHPSWRYIYGETGLKNGGPFPPHKTHQNGLSVDFMVPVKNEAGEVVFLPTSLSNRYGYDIEFDEKGHWKGLNIDFDSMVAHILALHEQAEKQGITIRRVIFDPQLQPFLWQASRGEELRDKVRFSSKRSWVRHDEHYHVDFTVKCRDYSDLPAR